MKKRAVERFITDKFSRGFELSQIFFVCYDEDVSRARVQLIL